MKKYKYIIFDFNGTIIDDVKLCLNILNKMLESNGHNKVNLDKYKHIFTFPIIKYYEAAGFDFTKESFTDLAINFIDDYQAASLKCQLYDKSIETFEYLIKSGYKLIILSASEINNLRQQTDHFGITKYFVSIFGLSDIHATSKIDLGLNFLKGHNINPSEVLMVGDTLHDKEVADKMQVDCYLVSCGHQHYNVLSINNNKVINQINDLINIL